MVTNMSKQLGLLLSLFVATISLLFLGSTQFFRDLQFQIKASLDFFYSPIAASINEERSKLDAIFSPNKLILEINKLKEQNSSLVRPVPSPVSSSEVELLSPAITITDGYLLIGKGSLQGVSKGDLLVVGDFLLGQIVEVASNYSKVQLVIADNESLAVSVNGYLALATGYGNLGVRLRELPASANVTTGNVVKLISTKASPLLGKYLVGYLSKKLSSESDSAQEWEVNYPIVISNLESAELVKSQ